MRRKFIPGSEWVYCKIYAGEHQIDTLLGTVVYDLVGGLKSEGRIDKWFFIRYRDESGFHLRLRLHAVRVGMKVQPERKFRWNWM